MLQESGSLSLDILIKFMTKNIKRICFLFSESTSLWYFKSSSRWLELRALWCDGGPQAAGNDLQSWRAWGFSRPALTRVSTSPLSLQLGSAEISHGKETWYIILYLKRYAASYTGTPKFAFLLSIKKYIHITVTDAHNALSIPRIPYLCPECSQFFSWTWKHIS